MSIEDYTAARSRILAEPSIATPIQDLAPSISALYGSLHDFQLYGLSFDALAKHDSRFVPRTILECTEDKTARQLTRALRRSHLATTHIDSVVDPFAGTANLAYWIAETLRVGAIGAEDDRAVFDSTTENLRRAEVSLDVRHCDWRSLVTSPAIRETLMPLFVLDPPWGAAFDGVTLRTDDTNPSIQHIIATIRGVKSTAHFIVKGVKAMDPPLIGFTELLEVKQERGPSTVFWRTIAT